MKASRLSVMAPALIAFVLAGGAVSGAGPLRDRLMASRADDLGIGELDTQTSAQLSKAITLAYGTSPKQVIDVYPKAAGAKAPVIIMVHGGGWSRGSRQSAGVVDNKLSHFGGQGYVFVSVDYRLIPEADPFEQTRDVARAIAYVEANIARYGGDPDNIILMGHSAGGHLVALLSADPSLAAAEGAKAWRGTVVLDAGALDVEESLSKKPHAPLYDKAFGDDPAFWARVSPMARLTPQALPMRLICSTKRADKPCGTVHRFADKAKAMGRDTSVSEQALTHAEINKTLGLPGDYTAQVDAFISARLKP